LEVSLPRALTDRGGIELRLRPEDKATLTGATSIKRLDLTGYILRAVLPQAQVDISDAERLTLSERDSLRVLALLENPPAAPDRLVRAAKAGFTLPGRRSPGRKRRSPSGTTAHPSIAASPISISTCNATPVRITKAAAQNASSPRPPTRRHAFSASTP
jgi:uncharacterized protein (DUF1778 family)